MSTAGRVPPSRPPPPEPTTPAMKHILIVEDDPIVSHAYLKRFRMEGWRVTPAASGEIALEILQTAAPDLAVLDMHLPKISGLEVLKFIRSHAATRDLPVIVFSNLHLPEQVRAAEAGGANLCLSKAVCTPKQLTDAVHSLLDAAPAPKPAPVKPAPAKPATRRVLKGIVDDESPAPPPPAPPAPPVTAKDTRFLGEVRKNFLNDAGQSVASLRHGLHGFVLNESDSSTTRWLADRSRILLDLHQTSHSVSRQAGVAGMAAIARLAAALEALLGELHERPNRVNPSTLRTVSHAVDFLDVLVSYPPKEAAPENDPTDGAVVLTVDDEPLSRKAVVAGLQKAGLGSVSLGEPMAALAKLTSEEPFDLVILDVNMPRMNGYELCVKLRGMPSRSRTPVVFVTSLSDFESCARSAISGGNDLIAKPIFPIELAVKAIMFVLKSRLGIVTKAV